MSKRNCLFYISVFISFFIFVFSCCCCCYFCCGVVDNYDLTAFIILKKISNFFHLFEWELRVIFECNIIMFKFWLFLILQYPNQWVTSYKLRVIILTSCIYCTSYELLFACELRVTVYCKSYVLFFKYVSRVTAYCTGYELHIAHELQVTVYCTSYELILTYESRITVYCASY